MFTDRIDHLSYVTKDADKAVEAWSKFVGKEPLFIDDRTETEGVKEYTFLFPHGIIFQEITDETKPYGAFLKDLPEGLHTLTVGVKNTKEAAKELEAQGYKQIRQNVAPTQGLKFVTYDTYEDLGFYVELQQYIDMFDYGYDETDVIN